MTTMALLFETTTMAPSPSPTHGGNNKPIVQPIPFAEHAMWLSLWVLYSLCALICAIQLVRIVMFRHKLLSFQAGFLACCFTSAFFRVLYLVARTT